MLSPNHFTRGAAVALSLGAIAVPAASARPARFEPVQAQARHATVAATPPARYARQDKQLVSLAPANNASAAAPAAISGSGFDWGDAGIGAAGGLAISIVAVGGAVGLSHRRTRKAGTPAAVVG